MTKTALIRHRIGHLRPCRFIATLQIGLAARAALLAASPKQGVLAADATIPKLICPLHAPRG
jgi:hypothetical protein